MRQLKNRIASGLTTIDDMMALHIFSMACAFMLQSNAYALTQHGNALAFQHAVQLINDIAQRWRLNPKRQTFYQTNWGQVHIFDDCQSAPCMTTQWAQRDLTIYKKQVASLLPKGDAQLQINQNPFSLNVVVS